MCSACDAHGTSLHTSLKKLRLTPRTDVKSWRLSTILLECGYFPTCWNNARLTWINAIFRLACRSPLRRVIISCCFRVAALGGHAASASSPSGRIRPSAICLRRAKRQGYRSIGKTLLTARSSLCGKWCLRSCTKIIIKAAMRRAAS